MNHPLSMPACLTGMALVLGLGSPVKALDQVIGDGPLQYESLPDIGTLQKNVDAFKKGHRSILQDSADARGMQVVPATDAIPLISQMSNDVTATRTPVPKWPPSPSKRRTNYLQLAQNMMKMPADAATQLSQTWCGNRDNNAQTMLAGSNTPAEASLAAQAMAKLDQWYPGWTNQVNNGRVSLVVTDQMPLAGQSACACVLPDSSRAYIMVSRQSLNQQQPPFDSLLFLTMTLRHENFHVQAAFNDGPNHQAGPDEEANAMRTNVDVMRKAANDPEWTQSHDFLWENANNNAFYADLVQRQDIPWDSVDGGSNPNLPNLYKPYNTSLQFLQNAEGFSQGQLTYLSSQPTAQGALMLLWQTPDGRKVQVTPSADGTCADIQFVGDPIASTYCVKYG